MSMSEKVLFRPVRSTLEDAMSEVVAIDSLEEIREFYGEDYKIQGKIKCKHYCFDARIGWDTWLVVDGLNQAQGYTNGHLPETD